LTPQKPPSAVSGLPARRSKGEEYETDELEPGEECSGPSVDSIEEFEEDEEGEEDIEVYRQVHVQTITNLLSTNIA
jgi:hypothetical protein